MKEKNNTQHHFSRRNFLAKSSMAAMGMLAVGPAGYASALDLLKKPNSKFSGVQIGVITYSYRSMPHDIHQLRSEEHTSELQSRGHLVCRLLLEKKTETTNRIMEKH